ncbi:nuclear factor 7, ovary-like [Hemiscyllium ocellatum]|uniref:nuclear factor 7, ovary-like n=1 Tax=Hemiscyllium ocellatum TaxID=170820 RepID=UPI002966A319|nr:nuclear factor 7, ovary-like [Hemiscyllium ocellatum]
MASKRQAQSLTEDIMCPICVDFFTDPVTLDCGHNFCRSCITQSWEKQASNSCPECREQFPDRNLRVNRAFANLAEKVRKLSGKLQEKESKCLCEQHQEELKLFCETDKKLICVICRDSQEHTEHHFISMEEAVGIYKEKVKCSFDSLTNKKAAVLETEQKQGQKISEIRKQAGSLQAHITSEFAKMHQFLTEKEQCLLQDLREEEEKVLKPMEKNLRQLQANLNSIQENLSKLQKQMEQKDEMLFLKEETSRKRSISDGGNVLSLADGALSIGKFTGLFQYTVWREMIDVIKPVAASLTLDQDTAHPEFIVNEDRTSVRLRDSACSYIRDHYMFERFDPSLYVWGSEGFTSGKHYWEVEVGKGRDWALGVTRESTKRKPGTIPDPEPGFWCLWKGRSGRYFAGSSPSWILLPLPMHPQKIGVFLDCEVGEVSFYNVDNMSHLHTLTQTFTEKMFPVFSPGFDSEPLRICDIENH